MEKIRIFLQIVYSVVSICYLIVKAMEPFKKMQRVNSINKKLYNCDELFAARKFEYDASMKVFASIVLVMFLQHLILFFGGFYDELINWVF